VGKVGTAAVSPSELLSSFKHDQSQVNKQESE